MEEQELLLQILGELRSVKDEVQAVKADTENIKTDVENIKADTENIKERLMKVEAVQDYSLKWLDRIDQNQKRVTDIVTNMTMK